MKVLLLLFATTAMAQNSETEINNAFQREYVYLVSQKEALVRQRGHMERSFADRIARAKATVESMQRQVARLSAANDERHEELMMLERQKKELQKRGSSLESTLKKATQTLADFKRDLRFDNNKEKVSVSSPENISLADLSPVVQDTLVALRQSAKQESFQGHYVDTLGNLKEGKITRMGRVAAFVQNQDGEFLLGPSGNGSLKILEPRTGNATYIFDSLSEAARLQRPATIVERLADVGPIMFLGLILLMVAGLFLVLVRI